MAITELTEETESHGGTEKRSRRTFAISSPFHIAASAGFANAFSKSLEIPGGAGVAILASVRIDPSTFEKITGAILGSAIEVHRIFGPGLLESTYTPCLHYELASRPLRFIVQRAIPIVYKGIPLDAGYRIDLIVDDLVVSSLICGSLTAQRA